MPSSRGVRAGRAYVELGLSDRLAAGLKRAGLRLKAFGTQVSAVGSKLAMLGAAALAPLLGASKVFSKMGDDIAKMARRTGVGVEALSELRFAASQSGTELKSLELGLRRMQRSIYDAGRELSTAVDALADLGLTFKDLDGLSPEAQFKLIADRLASLEDPTTKAAIAMSLFGRSGTMLLPMMAKGAKGIEDLQAKARKLGLTMSTQDALAAERFTDAMDSLWKSVKMAVFHIGAALAPVLQDLAEKSTDYVIRAGQWIKANSGLIVSALKLTAGLLALGIAVKLAGVAFVILGTAVTITGAILGAVLSPIGLVVAALAGLGTYLIYTSKAGGAAVSWLGRKFQTLKDDATVAYEGITAALKAGDIALAARILWATLKLEWQRGIGVLLQLWQTFKHGFLKIAYNAWNLLLGGLELIWHGLKIAWSETVAAMGKAWHSFTGWIKKGGVEIASALQSANDWIRSLFDSSFDYDAAEKANAQIRKAALAGIDSETRAAVNRYEEERKAAREAEDERHGSRMKNLAAEHNERIRALKAEQAAGMKGTEEEIARLEAELKALSEKAKKQYRERPIDGPDAFKDPSEFFNAAEAALAGLGATVTAATDKMSVAGTFGATAITRALGAGSAADRTAKATEESAKNTKPIRYGGVMTWA